MTYRRFSEDERKAIGVMGSRWLTPDQLSVQMGKVGGMAIMASLKQKGVVNRRGDRYRVKKPWRIFDKDGNGKEGA